MTTLQKALIVAALAVAIGTAIYGTTHASHLREQNEALQQQQKLLASQVNDLQRQRSVASNRLAALAGENARLRAGQKPDEV